MSEVGRVEAKFRAMIAELNQHCVRFMREEGIATEEEALVKAARAVVWCRYHVGWERLREAIEQLEDLVGRPQSETGDY